MAFNTPYEFLNPNGISYLVDRDHRKDREIYIDCLALFHDLLTEFSSMPDHSVFRINSIKKEIRTNIGGFQIQADTVRSNVNNNANTAFDLQSEVDPSNPNRQVTSYTARTLVDNFLNDLLEQYRIIQHPRVP